MASSSGGKTPDPAPTPIPGEWNAACDSCRSAPGIPFCRVEWSFLCAGCASVVHGHNWVVAVTPNTNPNSTLHSHPITYPYPFPCPNPNSDPNLVVHLSSGDEGDPNGPSNRRGRRRGAGRAPAHGRLESVMKYRQKRKSRTFEKTVRYANRKTNAEMMPRAEGKFARRSSGGEEAVLNLGEIAPSIMCEEVVHVGQMVEANAEEEAGRDWTDEIGTETSVNAGRLEGDEDFRLQ